MMSLLIGLNLLLLLAGMLLGVYLLHQSRRLGAAWRLALDAERQGGMQLAAQLALLVTQLEQTLQTAEPAPAPAAGGIEQAIRMAGEGAGAAAITRNCGLSRAEAELLVRIHGRARA